MDNSRRTSSGDVAGDSGKFTASMNFADGLPKFDLIFMATNRYLPGIF
jgi:hypothetical protein